MTDRGRRTQEIAMRCLANPGDDAAKAELIRSMTGLLRGLASGFAARYRLAEMPDLVSSGIVGIFRSLGSYQPDQASFATYARPAIVRHMVRCVLESRRIIIPKEVVFRTRGRRGLSPVTLEKAVRARSVYTCSDFQAMPEIVPFWDAIEAAEDAEIATIEAVSRLAALNPRSARVVVDHFGLGGKPEATYQRIGKELGITKERVRQILARAIADLSRRA